MKKEVKRLGALIFALCGAATAHAQTYDIDFFDGASTTTVDATGVFTYNASQPSGSQFSAFTVDWSGNVFDFTSLANSTPSEGHGCGSGNISFFSYLTSSACSSQLLSWFGGFQPSTSSASFVFSGLDNPVASSVAASGFVIPETGTFSVVQTPEIDPASAASGLTLLLGGVLVLRGRKRPHLAA
jgi:hypothetical protein